MRSLQRDLFLKKVGWSLSKIEKLAQDASFRTYYRLYSESKTAVLMDAPPPEKPAQFILVDTLLARAGAYVPAILAKDVENGFVLLEDLGDKTFTRLLNEGMDSLTLYNKALEALVQVQENIHVPQGALPLYDTDLMMSEVKLLPEWYIPHVLKIKLPTQALLEFEQIWRALIKRILTVPKTLVLLDYHVDNLMITPNGACGLLDFQDARMGPLTYDLMSLIEDARRPVPNEVYQHIFNRYLERIPQDQRARFKEACVLTAVQRHTKVIGIFVRLCVRDGKDAYLKHIPFVWRLLEKHLSHPLLKNYKAWLDTYVPETKRRLKPVLK